MPSAETQTAEIQTVVTQTEEIQPAEIHPTGVRPHYLPSPEEIAQVAAEIRAEWSPNTFRQRGGGGGSESPVEEADRKSVV